MRKIALVLVLGLFFAGTGGSAESSAIPPVEHKEFHEYAVKRIALLMKRAGFTIVQKKIDVVDDKILEEGQFTLFYITAAPDALKKYFQEPKYSFFAVGTSEDRYALNLSIRAYLNENAVGRPNQYYLPFYHLRLDKKESINWQNIAGSEDTLAYMRNKIVFGLLDNICAARSESGPDYGNGKIADSYTGAKSGLTVPQKKFSSEANVFLSLLFKELRTSFNIRFNVSEFYPQAGIKVYEFPRELENVVSPVKNRALLRYLSPAPGRAMEGFKVSNQDRSGEEQYFFIVEFPGDGNLEKIVKSAARDIFYGFYLPHCPGF